MRELLERVQESTDGNGLEPILVTFAYSTFLPPDVVANRVKVITAYYQQLMRTSKNVKAASIATRKWATQIYSQRYVDRTVQKVRAEHDSAQ